MNRIVSLALILSISCAGGVAFAGAVPLMVGGTAAVSSATDLSVIRVKGTTKSKTSTGTATKATPAARSTPAPKPAAPRPSLYSGPDFDNVLGLGNYLVTR